LIHFLILNNPETPAGKNIFKWTIEKLIL